MSLPPKIVKLHPEGNTSGTSFFIDGENFIDFSSRGGDILNFASLDSDGSAYVRHIQVTGITDSEGWRAEFRSPTQLKITLGFDVPPDAYEINVTDTRSSLTSDSATYKVQPSRYKVNFLRFDCTDESNELSGSDEVAFAWAVAADAKVFMKSTRQYEGIDQGGTYYFRAEDQNVLTPDGLYYPVIHSLAITTHLFEIDETELKMLKTNGTDFSKIADALANSGNDAAAAAATFSYLGDALASALSSSDGTDADDLGQQTAFFLAKDLIRKTRNVEQKFEQSLTFPNPDSEGSYIVYFEVTREFQL